MSLNRAEVDYEAVYFELDIASPVYHKSITQSLALYEHYGYLLPCCFLYCLLQHKIHLVSYLA